MKLIELRLEIQNINLKATNLVLTISKIVKLCKGAFSTNGKFGLKLWESSNDFLHSPGQIDVHLLSVPLTGYENIEDFNKILSTSEVNKI